MKPSNHRRSVKLRLFTMLRIRITTLVFSFLMLGGFSEVSQPKAFKIGVVPQLENRKTFKAWRTLLDHIESETGLELELVINKTISGFEEDLNKGVFDFAYVNPYHMLLANKALDYQPFLRCGNSQLQGIVVVNKNSDIYSLEDLKNQEIAFPSANALGATLMTTSELENKGIVTYPKFVKSHSSVYLHVAKFLVVGGGGVLATFEKQPQNVKNELRIIHKTESFKSHPIVFHPRVPKNVVDLFTSAFLSLPNNQPNILNDISITNPTVTSFEDYNMLRSYLINNSILTND